MDQLDIIYPRLNGDPFLRCFDKRLLDFKTAKMAISRTGKQALNVPYPGLFPFQIVGRSSLCSLE